MEEVSSVLSEEEDHERLLDQLICSYGNDVSDAELYSIGGFLIRKIAKATTCSNCLNGLSGNVTFQNVSVAGLVNCKTKGFLTHPAIEMFHIF